MTQTINIIELAETHGQTSYRNRADTAHPAYGFTEEGLQAFAHALLAAEGKCLHQIAEPVQAQMPDPVGVAFTFETEEGGALASQVTSSPSKLPMGWCNLYTEQQVRGYVDADRTQRAAAPQAVQAAVPSDAASDLKNALADAIELRQQLRLMEEHARGDVWRWQADAENELASMGNRMGVLILASDLRNLLAAPAHPAEGVPAQVMQEELAQLGYQFKDGRMIPPEYVGELLAVVQDAPCGCQFGTCETKVDSRCRMKSEIAATQPARTDDELRTMWRAAGGGFHGPSVETGAMPEAKLLPFLRGLAQPAAQGLDADGQTLVEILAANWAVWPAGQAVEQTCLGDVFCCTKGRSLMFGTHQIASDQGSAVVTEEQWSSQRAALAAQAKQGGA